MQLIENASKDKLRGGFYTPAPIARFILKWSLNGDMQTDILEPSCGDGVFLEEIKAGDYKYNSVTAIELDTDEAKKAKNISLNNTKIHNTDFHEFCNTVQQKFDIVIGNPPYIRYQYFNKEQQAQAERIFKRSRLKYSKLTNAWVSFVIGSSLMLKDKGKIGFVIPAELLQVTYAQQLRIFLAYNFNKINIVSFRKLVFPDIQQEVVLLLCEKNGTKDHLIEHIELTDAEDLKTLDISKLKAPKKKIDVLAKKWTFYFLEQKEIDFLERISKDINMPKIGHYAKTEVGITTGANDFFTVPYSTVEKYNMQEYAKPMVGRSVQAKGMFFTPDDWSENKKGKAKACLLVFPKMTELQNNELALKYIKEGEEKGIHKGYKNRIRDEWQIVPSLWVSDALFIRRNDKFPRLIINEAQAYTTDTMHRMKVNADVNVKAFAASYYNSLSLAFSEIVGRSYGGGVLELMPGEIKSIPLPYNEKNAEIAEKIDKMLREKTDILEILKYTNQIILKDNYGFSDEDIDLATSIWIKLSERRKNRNI